MRFAPLFACMMVLSASASASAASVPSSLAEAPAVTWKAPSSFIQGEGSFEVQVEIKAGEQAATIEGWAFSPAAFAVDGAPLQPREDGHPVQLAPGSVITIRFDLAPYLHAIAPNDERTFTLGYAEAYARGEPMTVTNWQAAPKGLNFMELPLAELGNYLVLIETNQGDMAAEFWPDVAPNHVRNFLDLAYTGFYDGTTFHRVIPGFMIQGGDPTGTGSGNGKRTLQAEFNARKHVAGVLSMARSPDPNSASCQFFVMHATAPHLDNQYSGFGQLVQGLDVVEKIVNTPRDRGDRPNTPQVIRKASVVLKPRG